MGKDFHRKVDGLAPTVIFGKLDNDTTIAAFTNKKWESRRLHWAKDSECMLLNLTN